MKGCAVVQPNIDRLSALLCDQHAHQIRSLAHREQRQVIDRFQVASVPIESNTEIDNRLFIAGQRIRQEFHFDADSRVIFRRRSCGLAEIFDSQVADEVTARVIFSGRYIFATVILAVPLR